MATSPVVPASTTLSYTNPTRLQPTESAAMDRFGGCETGPTGAGSRHPPRSIPCSAAKAWALP